MRCIIRRVAEAIHRPATPTPPEAIPPPTPRARGENPPLPPFPPPPPPWTPWLSLTRVLPFTGCRSGLCTPHLLPRPRPPFRPRCLPPICPASECTRTRGGPTGTTSDRLL